MVSILPNLLKHLKLSINSVLMFNLLPPNKLARIDTIFVLRFIHFWQAGSQTADDFVRNGIGLGG